MTPDQTASCPCGLWEIPLRDLLLIGGWALHPGCGYVAPVPASPEVEAHERRVSS